MECWTKVLSSKPDEVWQNQAYNWRRRKYNCWNIIQQVQLTPHLWTITVYCAAVASLWIFQLSGTEFSLQAVCFTTNPIAYGERQTSVAVDCSWWCFLAGCCFDWSQFHTGGCLSWQIRTTADRDKMEEAAQSYSEISLKHTTQVKDWKARKSKQVTKFS